MIDEHLIFEEKKPFLHITINRPEDGNKFLDDMLVLLAAKVDEAVILLCIQVLHLFCSRLLLYIYIYMYIIC